MRIRYRMILSFLLMAMIPLLFLIIQTNLAFNRQRNLVDNRITEVLDTISDGTRNLNREEIAKSLNEGQRNYDRAVESAQFSLILWGLLLATAVVVTGIWLAEKFASPVEWMAVTASRTLRVIQGMSAVENIAAVESTATVESTAKNIQPAPRDEVNLVSYTLGIMEIRVKDEFVNMEKQVSLRTGELKQFTDQLLDAVQIVRESAETLDVNHLLREAVQQIAQRFGFYHVGIYLVDESGQYAELKAADRGTGSQRMLEMNYRLKVGVGENHRVGENHFVGREYHVGEEHSLGEGQGEGIPGYVAATGEVYQSADISQDAYALSNPDLPSARSEIALPLRTRGAVIGVLDIQSTSLAKFTTEQIAILHVLTDQLALAVENARLFEQNRLALEAERRAYGEITRLAWDKMVHNRPEWGYRSEEQGIFRVEGEWHPWMVQAVQQGQVVVWQEAGFSIASVPIRVRDYTLGVLDFRKAGEDAAWMTEELALVQTLTDQLGQALESARLYQNTQMRAERERILSDITSKVRASTNVNVILQTAVKELAEALRVPKGAIQLRSAGVDGQERRYNSTGGG